MTTETDFYNVLKGIAFSLRSIDESLKSMKEFRKNESEQFIRESKSRMREKRISLLSESEKRELARKAQTILKENRINPDENKAS